MARKKIIADEDGQSLVELALTITFLLILLAGVIDLGRLMFVFIELRDAAEEGAIYGALSPTDTSGIIQHVRDYANTPVDLSDTGLVSVSVSTIGGACAGNSVEVTVTYTFTLTTPFLGTIIGSQTVPISSEATTTILRPPC